MFRKVTSFTGDKKMNNEVMDLNERKLIRLKISRLTHLYEKLNNFFKKWRYDLYIYILNCGKLNARENDDDILHSLRDNNAIWRYFLLIN